MQEINSQNALIGYTGFVGGHLDKFFKFDYRYNRENINKIESLPEINRLFISGMPAEKWKANLNPRDDYDNLKNLINYLHSVNVNEVILISTIDVYSDPEESPDESCSNFTESPYGAHRRILEEYVLDRFPRHYIIRLPALFGSGLKKNILYDLINHNQWEKISVNSSFQWYNMEGIGCLLNTVFNENINLLNVATEPIITMEIIENYFNNHFDKFNKEVRGIRYNVKSMHSRIFNGEGGYLQKKATILRDIEKFLNR